MDIQVYWERDAKIVDVCIELLHEAAPLLGDLAYGGAIC